jgi:hypothetical protein
MNPTLRAAHEYLERGWSVLPVGPDKKPLVRWGWLQKEHPRPDMLDRWFRDERVCVGVVCGRISEIFVLDVEVHALAYFRDLPSTLMALSQNFGAHYYYSWCEGEHRVYLTRENRHVGELRGDGCYVVAPPSRGTSGRRYRWLNAEPVAPLPGVFLREPPPPMSPCTGHESTTDMLPSNYSYASRNERLMAIARKVVAEGGDHAEVKAAFLADKAGSKLREKGKHGDKWVQMFVNQAKRYLAEPISGEVVTARVVDVARSKTELGERIRVKLRLPDGRVLRQGVTLLEGNPRTEAFQAALPDPQSGDTVRVEVFEAAYRGRSIWRVRRFLTEKEDDSHESQT